MTDPGMPPQPGRAVTGQSENLRFPFGRNWRSFLGLLDDRRIAEARRAVASFLGRGDLSGLRVLDVGSGSGLSSLVFHQLGAEVFSFDYDPDSVACTRLLRERHGARNPSWTVEQGSVLDHEFLEGLGRFDLVYAWGVLHHTGDMWRALDLASRCVAPNGQLFIAIYNDQGWRSGLWRRIKRTYCSGFVGRYLVSATMIPLLYAASIASDLRHLRWPGHYLRHYASHRGMSAYHDWHDWLGGYPFETSTPKRMMDWASQSCFRPVRTATTKGWGCNEFLLEREAESQGR